MASDRQLKYEAEHVACYLCSAETKAEFDTFIRYLREYWEEVQNELFIARSEADNDNEDE